jgi:hypothetical protein
MTWFGAKKICASVLLIVHMFVVERDCKRPYIVSLVRKVTESMVTI